MGGRIAVFVDAGYFWVQAVYIVHGRKLGRDSISVNYPSLRSEFLDEIKAQFPDRDLLRIYWYDGPSASGKSTGHTSVEELDDFKLRLGTRNKVGDQKAVDGSIIADLIGLVWPPVPTCLNLAGLKLLMGLERRACCAQVIGA